MALLKNLFFATTFNLFLFLILIIVIQNSSINSRVNFLKNKTINLPISFIMGTSFISGSFLGLILPLNLNYKKNTNL